ncbi:MAG TPA: FAD binding domain-containing protein [Saprospiraceae bacterium]|nr:FAD binding domain-containing protein [Saprospiraceae bacterium]
MNKPDILHMIQFILNEKQISTTSGASTTLLDFIRYQEGLKGTKIGCREGDCGACTVLSGRINSNGVYYASLTSCLTPLANVQESHVVTVEGLSGKSLSRIQEAFVASSATQCGFCTPGFVVSLSGFVLNSINPDHTKAIEAMDGNICRCTGYKSIEKAALHLISRLKDIPKTNKLEWLINQGFFPEYFLHIKKRLRSLEKLQSDQTVQNQWMGGGTDLYVQKHDELHDAKLSYIAQLDDFQGINTDDNDQCIIKGGTNATQLKEHPVLQQRIPQWINYMKLISSTPIRNMGTVAGNFVNASPIGDLTIIFLALNAKLALKHNNGSQRIIPLKNFYLGYKQLVMSFEERMEEIIFTLPGKNERFHFEKVSKRRHLDIASVNSAIRLQIGDNTIRSVHCSVGGVAPIPLYLEKTNSFLMEKPLTNDVIAEAAAVMQSEISPISDARGTAEYKRLLARQLFYCHFEVLFPEFIQLEKIL